MNALLAHAKNELDIIGEHGPMRKHLLTMVETFSDEGHSGFSASYAVSALEKLLRFEPLKPLTGDDGEWMEVGEGMEQNIRCSRVFRENGKVYDIEGFVFRDPDGSCYTNGESRRDVVFPYTPKTEIVDRGCALPGSRTE
jgi:hypothetical protein